MSTRQCPGKRTRHSKSSLAPFSINIDFIAIMMMMASASHLELTLPPHHFTSAFNSKYLFWPSTFIFLCSSTGRPFLPYCSHTLLLYLLTHLQTAAVNASTRPKRALANKMLFFCVCVLSHRRDHSFWSSHFIEMHK